MTDIGAEDRALDKCNISIDALPALRDIVVANGELHITCRVGGERRSIFAPRVEALIQRPQFLRELPGSDDCVIFCFSL